MFLDQTCEVTPQLIAIGSNFNNVNGEFSVLIDSK